MKGRNNAQIIRIGLIVAIIIVVNILSQYFYTVFDFTEDKRYTLTEPTKAILEEQDDIIYVKVLLDGDYPAGFKRLQRSAKELLDDFRSISPFIEYAFENPLSGSVQEINQRKELLRNEGIPGIQLRIDDSESRTQTSIYPYAIFHFGKRQFVVNLLEPQVKGISDEVWLNNSISLLEYKFANAIQKLKQEDKPTILFTTGKGELIENQTARLESKLAQYYQLGRIKLDSAYKIHPDIDLLIIAKPTKNFSVKNQFVLDQYLMQGGNIIWLIDKLNINLDSINRHKFYIPEPYPLGLDDLWFKYGVRLQNNLVQDLECTRIPQVVGVQGDKTQIEKFRWYYHPLVTPDSDHPIVNNLDQINLYSPGSIDTIKTKTAIKKTILLHSSKYSRFQLSPARVTFDILQYAPEIKRFNKPFLPFAVLLEGNFESFFIHKLPQSTREMLDQIGEEFIPESVKPGKMIFVSDGDLIKNLYDSTGEKISPIGYNKWENHAFIGNEDFISNAIEYMVDDKSVLTARSKKLKLRLLDKVKANAEKTKWRIINILFPIAFIIVFGFVFTYFRKKKYTKED